MTDATPSLTTARLDISRACAGDAPGILVSGSAWLQRWRVGA